MPFNEISYETDVFSDDEILQSTALLWLAELLTFTQEVMVPFTPRLIPAILPNLAHHVPMIQTSAIRTNKLLLGVIQTLPSPSEPPSRQSTQIPITRESGSVESLTDSTASPTPSNITMQKRASLQVQAESVPPPRLQISLDGQAPVRSQTPRPPSPQSLGSATGPTSVPEREIPMDAFDYQATVNALTIQFLSEHEETRVAALKWLIMLHQKAPKKVRHSFPLRPPFFIVMQTRFSRWMTGHSRHCSRHCPTPPKK